MPILENRGSGLKIFHGMMDNRLQLKCPCITNHLLCGHTCNASMNMTYNLYNLLLQHHTYCIGSFKGRYTRAHHVECIINWFTQGQVHVHVWTLHVSTAYHIPVNNLFIYMLKCQLLHVNSENEAALYTQIKDDKWSTH